MDPNLYLPRQYSSPPCWELVTDVMRTELNASVTAFKSINSTIRKVAEAFRLALHKSPEGLTPIGEPQDLCIVLLGKSQRLGYQHCGIYWQGSVLHATNEGNLFQDMATVRDAYSMIEYWALA